LREELQAAEGRPGEPSTYALGQFTAGFMHEFNNPWRLLRQDEVCSTSARDASLCADLEQMLKETRYMGNIARTLCSAEARAWREIFDASVRRKHWTKRLRRTCRSKSQE